MIGLDACRNRNRNMIASNKLMNFSSHQVYRADRCVYEWQSRIYVSMYRKCVSD